ncbi:MAG TPA: hypothetical protein VGG40_09285 [Solirubrobacterales bacterium]|jgi:modulator of FtsH protease
MVAYDPGEWSDFFVAVAGASAALLGLLFVAVSINLQRILEYDGLPERALETLLLLLSVLIVAFMGLAPGQAHTAVGIEVLVLGLLMGLVSARIPVYAVDERTGEEPVGWRLSRWGVRAFSIVPFVLGGLSLLLETGGGLYWILAGTVFATCGAVAGAWVLMVEILR